MSSQISGRCFRNSTPLSTTLSISSSGDDNSLKSFCNCNISILHFSFAGKKSSSDIFPSILRLSSFSFLSFTSAIFILILFSEAVTELNSFL
ncbi:hypothetical protein A3A95_00645 [Candidatus Nomurabacteria bacterium RIFCSPLOWO2_01_FULL_39_18]|uniref:Uncharacterized protein n=1 Tax=Candidatus Nomurabacteria bacterium RIFCSPHIGHO2_01_FULL_40_24b TaxID=1801739 RepID=A0A1F6V8B5_9BACT|nr:MAG: hypothetical protein A2647_01565 [Candidatus Nomurabacteria bacterium RIFCSPHIGHO2_01_FULL_40_24b]OGI89800.1 MAG: hypothetical protein A3A95_00645 [Candidatus Nomurabacteria bacterium RIFCSPLOWO2_01_FULL_39_18]